MESPIKVGLKYIEIWKESMEDEVLRYEAEPVEEGQIVFYGPSNFTRWTTRHCDTPLREALPGASGRLCAVNRGFGSSCTEHQLYYYPRLIRPLKPSALVYCPGLGNGIAFGYTSAQIFELAQRVVLYALSDFPDMRVYLVGLNLNHKRQAYQAEFDGWLREFADSTPNCKYLDVTAYQPLAREDIYVPDNVHFNNEGYRIYGDFFREALKEEFARF